VLVVLRTRILTEVFAVKTLLTSVLQMVSPVDGVFVFIFLDWDIQHLTLVALGFTVSTAASHNSTATGVAKMLIRIR
jgi:hypothetical protein